SPSRNRARPREGNRVALGATGAVVAPAGAVAGVGRSITRAEPSGRSRPSGEGLPRRGLVREPGLGKGTEKATDIAPRWQTDVYYQNPSLDLRRVWDRYFGGAPAQESAHGESQQGDADWSVDERSTPRRCADVRQRGEGHPLPVRRQLH